MNKPLILVVEDDSTVRNLITTTLKSNEYRFITAPTGEAAISAATTQQPDILFLDLGLPDMDGIAIIKRIRSWSQMPIIVISARSEDADKVAALDAGADDYLTKPFSVTELLARLRVAQRRISAVASNSADSVFRNGGLTIDYGAGCVTLSGEEMKLTPTEYKLLCLLAKDAGKVLTHAVMACHWILPFPLHLLTQHMRQITYHCFLLSWCPVLLILCISLFYAHCLKTISSLEKSVHVI